MVKKIIIILFTLVIFVSLINFTYAESEAPPTSKTIINGSVFQGIIKIDSKDRIFLVSIEDESWERKKSVNVYDKNGNFLSNLSIRYDALEIDREGNVIILCGYGGYLVKKHSPEGKLILNISGLNTGSEICFTDNENNIYITYTLFREGKRKVYVDKYDKNGSLIFQKKELPYQIGSKTLFDDKNNLYYEKYGLYKIKPDFSYERGWFVCEGDTSDAHIKDFDIDSQDNLYAIIYCRSEQKNILVKVENFSQHEDEKFIFKILADNIKGDKIKIYNNSIITDKEKFNQNGNLIWDLSLPINYAYDYYGTDNDIYCEKRHSYTCQHDFSINSEGSILFIGSKINEYINSSGGENFKVDYKLISVSQNGNIQWVKNLSTADFDIIIFPETTGYNGRVFTLFVSFLFIIISPFLIIYIVYRVLEGKKKEFLRANMGLIFNLVGIVLIALYALILYRLFFRLPLSGVFWSALSGLLILTPFLPLLYGIVGYKKGNKKLGIIVIIIGGIIFSIFASMWLDNLLHPRYY